jgi:hypothetical protein
MSDTSRMGAFSPPLRLTGKLLDDWQGVTPSDLDELVAPAVEEQTKEERSETGRRDDRRPSMPRAGAPGAAR